MELNFYQTSNFQNLNQYGSCDGEFSCQPSFISTYYDNIQSNNNILNNSFNYITIDSNNINEPYFDSISLQPTILETSSNEDLLSPSNSLVAECFQNPAYYNDFSQASPDILYSPESSDYPSSAEQSPHLPEIEDIDLILSELETTGIDESLLFQEDDFNNLFENVNISNESDKLNFDNNPNIDSIISNSPSNDFDFESAESLKIRKLSTASSDYYPSSNYSSSSDYSSSSSPSPSPNVEKKKRLRKSKHTKEERAARKKDQNKKAAERYRNKKKFELEIHEHILEELEQKKAELAKQFKKIETEFNVILPLAKATFQKDPSRNIQLQQLLERLITNQII